MVDLTLGPDALIGGARPRPGQPGVAPSPVWCGAAAGSEETCGGPGTAAVSCRYSAWVSAPGSIPIDHKALFQSQEFSAQHATQRVESLAQALPGPHIRALPPQQSGQFFPAVGHIGFEDQVSEKSQGFGRV
jgi:hypothetical protein